MGATTTGANGAARQPMTTNELLCKVECYVAAVAAVALAAWKLPGAELLTESAVTPVFTSWFAVWL